MSFTIEDDAKPDPKQLYKGLCGQLFAKSQLCFLIYIFGVMGKRTFRQGETLVATVSERPRPCENSRRKNQTCVRVLWFVVFRAIAPNN